jgi:hypothetical protein
MTRPPKSRTQSIKGDAQLTTLIDPFVFLTDEDFLFSEEEIPETPDEGQCQ